MSQKTSGTDGVPAKGKGQNQSQSTKADQQAQAQIEAQVQAEVEKLSKELEAKYEGHVSNVRSDLMRAHAEREKKWDEQDRLNKQRIMDLETKDLDEPVKARYEADMFRGRVSELSDRVDPHAHFYGR